MIKPWLKHMARLYLPVYQYESEKTKIVYAGYSPIKKSYFVRLLLDKNCNQTYLGQHWFWDIPDIIKSCNIDMLFSEISWLSFNHFQKCDGYILPVWASLTIDIDRPINEICNGYTSGFSKERRRIRKFNLTYEILTDKKSLNNFIHNFYLPYITKRFGKEAMVEDLNIFLKLSPSPFLMAIKENGIMIAGSLMSKTGDYFCLIRHGLLDGNEEYLHHGAMGAIYYFGLLEGQKMGCRYFDLGGARPFLTDGLTKYKMGLGADFVLNYSSHDEFVWFGVNEHSNSAREFISKNPFMYLNKDKSLVRYNQT
jgi:hypothetical protein